jgi:Luciferase-like monooxygenase
MRWSIADRNAASVLPEPVGARTSTLSPCAIAGQASSCARVGVWNVASNHASVAGLKVASGSLPTNTEVTVRPMEIGLGVDSRYSLGDEDQRAVAREAAALGYTSLWTPIGNTPEPFDICGTWTEVSGLPSGIAVAPLSGWSIEALASVSKKTFERCRGRFTLGIGSGRTSNTPIRAMREAVDALRPRLPGARIYLGALGPQMLHLAGERYDGAALNWCTTEQVRWSRDRVAAGARAAGRDPASVRLHEYVRVCIDDDEHAARLAFAKMVMTYALAGPGADKTKGYRAHFARMGFDETLTDLEARRERGATEDELARIFPDDLLRRVGYWGKPEGARAAFSKLAEGLDYAVVRLVPARRNDLAAARFAFRACAPKS